MKTYLLKLDDAILKDWVRQAKRKGMSLAELIRFRMGKQDGIEAANKNSRRPTGDPVLRRRGGVAAPRGRGIDVHVIDKPREKLAIPAHDPTCQCGVCEFKRTHLKGKKK